MLITQENKIFSEIKKISNENFKYVFKNYRQTLGNVIEAVTFYKVSKSIIYFKNISKTPWNIINNLNNNPKVK